MTKEPLYLLHISLHGLLRSEKMELGRDADTGGQIRYVVELANALGQDTRVERVDLLTRQISDPKVDSTYAEEMEVINSKAFIFRLRCGPRRYLRKEVLWPYLDCFVDQVLKHIRRVGKVPDIIHSHYADAGYIGCRLSALLGVPLIFTGHSLGRVKRATLLEKGMKKEVIDQYFNIYKRIDAEEENLMHAACVVASTQQEVNEQYALYDHYPPHNMHVIPPGIDISTFTPMSSTLPPIEKQLDRFLQHPKKPLILAISRADERKNLGTLVEAYATTPSLKEKANLALIMGNRTEIRTMEKGSKDVLTKILLQIDTHDLYGKVAYLKQHLPSDIPDLYRLAASTKGIFVNPALTEPFGLTLIEAAACGLPIVATNDGGPKEIIQNCNNGVLINPFDSSMIGKELLNAISNDKEWKRRSTNGIRGVTQNYSWDSHVNRYLNMLETKVISSSSSFSLHVKNRLPTADLLLVCDIDNTLTGDAHALVELFERLRSTHKKVCFAIATGRNLRSTLEVLQEWKIPTPDIFITSVGTEIYYPKDILPDTLWRKTINYRWDRENLLKALLEFQGIKLQKEENQSTHKISFLVDPKLMPKVRKMSQILRRKQLYSKLVYSHERYLDCLPLRASKGSAVRYLSLRWGLSMDQLLVAGDSGNDSDMLSGNSLGIVVGNYSPELEKLKGAPNIYFASQHHAKGILEGLDHYNFLEKKTINIRSV